MTTWTRTMAMGVALSLTASGCGWSYWPIRWPARELWTPAAASAREPIQLPAASSAEYANRAQIQDVTIGLDCLDAERTKQVFGTDLLSKHIQPLLLLIDNRSRHAYHFTRWGLGVPVVPAGQVARRVHQHPLRTGARVVKWVLFLVPGLVFSAIVEPATTFEFPGIKEAATRPPAGVNRAITADFQRVEFADGVIAPETARAGVLFTRPLRPDTLISVTLTNTETEEPLMVRIPVPRPGVDTQRHIYAHPYANVWEVATETAKAISSWTVVSRDQDRGMMTVKKGGVPFWWMARRMTLLIEPLDATRTQVQVQGLGRGASVTAPGRQRGLDKFFQELDQRLPAPQPVLPPKLQGQPAAQDRSVPQAVPSAGRP